jgi:hypothetical protein
MVRHYTIITPRYRSMAMGAEVPLWRLPESGSSSGSLTRPAQREPSQGHVAPDPDVYYALLPRSTGLLLSLEFVQNSSCVTGFGTPYRAAAEIAICRGRGPGLPWRYNPLAITPCSDTLTDNGVPVCPLSRDAVAVCVPEAIPGDRGQKFR